MIDNNININNDGFIKAELYIKEAEGVSAVDAANLYLLKGIGTLCLAYAPDFCGFVKCSAENFISFDGRVIPAESVFELRCFCDDFELRWVREGDTGRYVIISQKMLDGLKILSSEFQKRSGRYLLWGKVLKRDDVIYLFEHRVGALALPYENNIKTELADGGRVWLKFDEFFSYDDYGNMVWRLEMLKGLEVK